MFDGGFQVDLFGDRWATPVSAVGEGPVECQDHASCASVTSPFHTGTHGVAIAGPVDLEERLWVSCDYVFEWFAAKRTESHRHATGSGGTSHGDFTLGVHCLHAGWRDHDRHRGWLTHDRGRHLAVSVLSCSYRTQSELIKRRQIVVTRDTSFSASDDGAIHRTRKALFRASFGDSNGFKPRISHRMSLRRRLPTATFRAIAF